MDYIVWSASEDFSRFKFKEKKFKMKKPGKNSTVFSQKCKFYNMILLINHVT